MMRKRMKHFVSAILLCAMFLQIAAPDSLSAATVDQKLYTGSVELIQDGALTGVVIERVEKNMSCAYIRPEYFHRRYFV